MRHHHGGTTCATGAHTRGTTYLVHIRVARGVASELRSHDVLRRMSARGVAGRLEEVSCESSLLMAVGASRQFGMAGQKRATPRSSIKLLG